jgi:NitT/TauT family transport system substrate-binding protein
MKKKLTRFAALVVLLPLIFLMNDCARHSTKNITVRYGITPYQDSGLPVVAERLGWYKEAGINVELVPVDWGDVVTAISGNAIDVCIYNFNSFQPPYENAVKGTKKPVFYCPFFLFKGQAIMVGTNAGYQVVQDSSGVSKQGREERIANVAKQLKGKRIAVTEGTELEQIVLAALQKAGLTKQDITIIHASPADCLAAFLAGNVDVFAAGLTERVEARRHGATELLVESDVMLPVIDGIVTTTDFAQKNPEVMNKLVSIWFRTIRFMEENLNTNSSYILDYLAKKASTHYTPEEYSVAWTFDVFPSNAKDADKYFNDPTSPGYWKTAWDANNQFLMQQRKIINPVPYSAYLGDSVLKRLSNK